MALINIKNCTLLVRGGTLGQFVALKIGNGNLTYDEKRPIEYVKDRGLLDTVREADDEPMDVRFDIQWSHIVYAAGDPQPSLEEALKNIGQASAWISSATDVCEPYAVDVVIKDLIPCGTEMPETIILPDFRYESLAHDLKAGTIACTGKCNSKRAMANRGALQSY